MTDLDRNPQHAQMADESMLRTLAAQASAIWPQEREIIAGYGLAPRDDAALRIIDVGCGSGEIAARLAELFPSATIVGVDIIETHLDIARRRCASYGERVSFETGDAFALRFEPGYFDLVVCRHVLQSIPQIDDIITELTRILRAGGRLHLLVEDYAMLHFSGPGNPDRLWQEFAIPFGAAVGTNMRIGRYAYTHLKRAGLDNLSVDYVVVDTLRVDREVFAQLMTAWRDGFAKVLAEHANCSVADTTAMFDEVVATIRNPDAYSVWHVPIVSARKPLA